jgi:hypothetical protein
VRDPQSPFILHLFSSLPSQRYIVRDFQYSSDQIEQEREELQTADTAEKELWVSPPPITPPMTTFRSSVDGAPSAFGNQLLRGFPSFRAPQGGSIVCRKCIKIRSSRELYRNRCQSECFNHLLSQVSEELLVYTKARAEDYKADAHDLTTALRLPFSALPGTRQFEGW